MNNTLELEKPAKIPPNIKSPEMQIDWYKHQLKRWGEHLKYLETQRDDEQRRNGFVACRSVIDMYLDMILELKKNA